MKRRDYISWDTCFMEMAHLIAKRSKDPKTQVGAVIVRSDNIVVGLGFNGLPRGMSDDEWDWDRPAKYDYVIHAEENAILNSNQASLRGCRIYIPFFSCNKCARLVIQVGISEVIYAEDYLYDTKEMQLARKMYDDTGVRYRKYMEDKR